MDQLKLESFATEVRDSALDLFFSHSTKYDHIFTLINDNVTDDKVKDEIFSELSGLVTGIFDVGFYQGVAWSQVGVEE